MNCTKCMGCEKRFAPYVDEEGQIHSCRHDCPDWQEHEAAKQANYERHKAHIDGIVISEARERCYHRLVTKQKQGRKRG